jgi:hypothetical protein
MNVWVPTDNVVTLNLAVCKPLIVVSATPPTGCPGTAGLVAVVPSRKVTLPVGGTVPVAGLTTALSLAVEPASMAGVLVVSVVRDAVAAAAGSTAANSDRATTPRPTTAVLR